MKWSIVVQPETVQLWMLRLHSNSNWQVRKTLREICEASQARRRLPNNKINGFILTIKGLYDDYRIGGGKAVDVEINRWVLKALIELGNYSDLSWFKEKAKNCGDEENSVWIAVGIFKHSVDFATSMAAVGPLHLTSSQKDLAICMANRFEFYNPGSGLKIESAGKIELLIACVAFAVRRDLREIFEPRFEQSSQLIALNEHHDLHVRQYSIYAMWRIPELTFADSKLRLVDIREQDVSVRRWSYELVLKEENSVRRDLAFWKQVAEEEDSDEALEGFANGIYAQFADGLPDIVLTTLADATSERVRLGLLRHICRNCEEDESYYEIAIDEFNRAPVGGVQRAVCSDAAIETKLFREFKLIEIQTSAPSLFDEGDVVMGDKVQGDKVTIGSNQVYSKGNKNKIKTGSWTQAVESKRPEIEDLLAALRSHGNSDEEAGLRDDLEELKSKPSEGLLERIVSKMKLISSGSVAVKEVVDAAAPLVDAWSQYV